MNKIDTVYSFIEDELNAKCMVMYPNDIWKSGDSYDSNEAISNYKNDYSNISKADLINSKKIEIKYLVNASLNYVETLKKGYPKEINIIEKLKTNIYLTDYNKTFTLSGAKGLIEVKLKYDECDIAISSEPLLYWFQNLWGAGTLNVNGRFQIPKQGNYYNFRSFITISSALNRKDEFPFKTPPLPARIKRKIKHLLTKLKSH